MSTTRVDIETWLKRASPKQRWVVVMCDTFDWSDYPVYCETAAEVWDQIDRASEGRMSKFMECYDLSLPIEPQLSEVRARHIPSRPLPAPPRTDDEKEGR